MGSIPRFLDLFDMDFFLLAMRYTLLEQEVLESEFPLCEKRGVGIVVGGGFNSGILATGAVQGAMYNYAPAGPDDPRTGARRSRRSAPATTSRCRPRRSSFRSGTPSSASIIPGAISRAKVEKNVAAFRHPIPADLWAELKHEKLIRADAPVPVKAPSGQSRQALVLRSAEGASRRTVQQATPVSRVLERPSTRRLRRRPRTRWR